MARPFAEIARVKNVSLSGAVLLGVRSKIRAGEILDVQHGIERAQFRIVWTRAGRNRNPGTAIRTCDFGLRSTEDV